MASHSYWPFNPRSAWWVSAVLVPVTIIAVVALGRSGMLPLSWWLLLGAVVLSLLPVLLLVLDQVSSVKAPGVEVVFAAVHEAVQTAEATTGQTTIFDNLGIAPGPAPIGEHIEEIIEALRATVTKAVGIVDLGDGHLWWQTRLLILTAGASRLGYPSAIVFTATVAGRPKQYLGWATPAELLRTQLSRSAQLRQAHRRAQRKMLLVELAEPDPNRNQQLKLPWLSTNRVSVRKSDLSHSTLELLEEFANAQIAKADSDHLYLWPDLTPASPSNGNIDDTFLAERLLLSELDGLETSMQREELDVTVSRLNDLFMPVLHDEVVERNAPEPPWFTTFLNGTTDYVAVTDRGQYVSLVARIAATNAVLHSLVGEHLCGRSVVSRERIPRRNCQPYRQ